MTITYDELSKHPIMERTGILYAAFAEILPRQPELVSEKGALAAWEAIRVRQFEYRLHAHTCPKFVLGPANTDRCTCEVATLEAALKEASHE